MTLKNWMGKGLPLLLFVFCCNALGDSFSGLGQTLILNIPEKEKAEVELSIQYRLKCEPSKLFETLPALIGEVVYPSRRRVRFLLPFGSTRQSILLGTFVGSSQLTFRLQGHANCDLKGQGLELNFKKLDLADLTLASNQPTDAEWDLIARKFAPFLVPRDDQLVAMDLLMPNDWHLGRGFDFTYIAPGRYEIRYTEFFSDEDSKTSSSATDEQMGRYGRRTDIEWSISGQITIGKDLKPRWDISTIKYQPAFHASFFNSLGTNAFLTDSTGMKDSHPILYVRNSPKNNVFSNEGTGRIQNLIAQGTLPLLGSFLAPIRTFHATESRETLQFENPWMALISDWELKRQGKISTTSTEFLYARVQGHITRGSFRLALNGAESMPLRSPGTNDRFGEDLFGKESFMGIPVSTKTLNAMLSGEIATQLQFEETSYWRESDVELDDVAPIEFWRLRADPSKGYVSEILSLPKMTVDRKVKKLPRIRRTFD